MFFWKASPLLEQIWTVSGIILFNVACGMMNSKIILGSPVIHTDSPMIKDSQTSPVYWIGSAEPLIIITGLLSSALIMHWFGRRPAYLMTVLASIISCCTIYFASSTSTTNIGRLFRFFTDPGVILGAMAIGEYTNPIYRGVFIILASLSLEIGRITAHFIEIYKIIAILALALNILSFSVVCTWEESPYFLASRYKYDKSKKSFIALRGNGLNERHELLKLIQKGKEDESNITSKIRLLENLLDAVKKVTMMKFLKPVIVIIFASILLEASGKATFATYGSEILFQIFRNYPSFYTSAFYFIAPISMIFSSILVRFFKRRTLLFHTGAISVIILFIISLTIFLILNTDKSLTTFLPLAIILFSMLTNLNCTTIFVTWCGELFPLEHKSVGLVISGLILNINSFLSLKFTPYLINGLKLNGMFGLLAVLLTLALLTLYFIAPETHDKTLLQIECYFENSCFESNDDERRRENEDIFFV